MSAEYKRTDRQELEILRVSLARIAQAVGVETEQLPVLDKSYNELAPMAREEDRGWNALAGLVAHTICDHVHIRKMDAKDVVTALKCLADRENAGDGSYSDYLYGMVTKIEGDLKSL